MRVPETFDAGVVIGDRFELVRRLGAGSTGVVWSAKDLQTATRVAVKLLHPNVFKHQMLLEHLRREVEVLDTLHHPNIARPVDFFAGEPHAYLAMELVEGPTLDLLLGEHAADDRHLLWEHALPIIEQLLSAMHHAHQKFIVHRDLKPQNIALESTIRGPVVKVLDFGIAKFLEGGLFDATTLGRRLGSLYYMSPEQLRGDPADVRSDVFALGAILFELLTLRRAWPRDEEGGFIPAFVEGVPRIPANAIATLAVRISTEPRPRATAVRELPAAIDDILMRSMAIEPGDRYASVHELREAIVPVLAKVAGLEPTFVEDRPEDRAEPTVLDVPDLRIATVLEQGGEAGEADTRPVPRIESTIALDTRSIPDSVLPPAETRTPTPYWLFVIIALASAVSVVALGILIRAC